MLPMSGRAILFNTVVSLVFVLRYLMTFLRNMGLAHKLPLDHSIYFHKVVGWLIFSQAWLHTIAHLINFGESTHRLPLYNWSLLSSLLVYDWLISHHVTLLLLYNWLIFVTLCHYIFSLIVLMF